MTMINNARELAEYWCGYTLREGEKPQDVLDKWVFKETECGAWCWLIGDITVSFGSIIEGHDYEPPTHQLNFPFDSKEMGDAIQQIEEAVSDFLCEVQYD